MVTIGESKENPLKILHALSKAFPGRERQVRLAGCSGFLAAFKWI